MLKSKVIYPIVALFFTVNVTAQISKQDSLQVIQDNRLLNYFELTTNAATIGLTPIMQHGFASVNATNTNGDFRQPMEADATNQINIATGGFKKLNGWFYKTNFTYSKQYDKNIAWSGVADAYEGNPFIWADSSSGNWERDHINTAFSVTSPIIFKKLQTGLTLDYQIGLGARITEPKPFYRRRNIAFQPGINYLITQKKSVGIASKINFIQEENELGFYSNSNVLLYRLRGFGTFSKSPFVNGERKRKGTDFEVTAHYHQQLGKYQFLISGFAAQRDEVVNEGVAIQQATGYFTEIRFGGKAALQTGNASNGKSLMFNYQIKNGFADDVIFRAESASYTEYHISTEINFWHTSADSKSLWQFTASPQVGFINNTDQATLTQFNANNIGTNFTINWRKQINQNIDFQIKPFIGYYITNSSDIINQRPNVITENLILTNYQFFTSNYGLFGSLLSLNIKPSNSNLLHSIYAKANQSFVSNHALFTNRNNFQFNYSIIF
jgi:hypothetical protein